jgi:hypothetical protein
LCGKRRKKIDVTGEGGARGLATPQEWDSYLREYSAAYLQTANEYERARLDPKQAATRWMGRMPAAESAVVAAEQRLGTQFPPSFRSFLLTTDGWDGVGGWIDLVYPCEDIAWMRDTEGGRDLIGVYAGDLGEEGEHEYVTLFRRSLEVASGEDFWLLDPEKAGPGGEWAAYQFEPKAGELKRFASFAELFHDSFPAWRITDGRQAVTSTGSTDEPT